MCKAIIFDVDGTLIDGTEGILKSVSKAINYFNLPMPNNEKLLEFVGPPIQNSCKMIFNTTDDFAQDFANFFRKVYAGGDVYDARVYNEIYNLLDLLKILGYKLGVATYKRQDYAINLMKHFNFDKYFNSICGADNENKLKKFDILANCLLELNANKDNSILIGDSYHDAEAAQKMRINFIGVTYGFGFKTREDVLKYDSIFVAENVKKIIEYFKSMEEL